MQRNYDEARVIRRQSRRQNHVLVWEEFTDEIRDALLALDVQYIGLGERDRRGRTIAILCCGREHRQYRATLQAVFTTAKVLSVHRTAMAIRGKILMMCDKFRQWGDIPRTYMSAAVREGLKTTAGWTITADDFRRVK